MGNIHCFIWKVAVLAASLSPYQCSDHKDGGTVRINWCICHERTWDPFFETKSRFKLSSFLQSGAQCFALVLVWSPYGDACLCMWVSSEETDKGAMYFKKVNTSERRDRVPWARKTKWEETLWIRAALEAQLVRTEVRSKEGEKGE